MTEYRPIQGRARMKAMTLLEVMLAVVICAGVLGGSMSFYHHALGTRDALEEKIRTIETTRRAMELMTSELRWATKYPFLNMGLEGQGGQMQFVSTRAPSGEMWIVAEEESARMPSGDLRIVGYRLGLTEDEETGEELITGLERTVQKSMTVRVADEEEEVESSVVGPNVGFVMFRYWQDGTWLDNWAGGDLPMAVEISLGFEPLDEGLEPEDYQGELLRRVVCVPQAAGRQRERHKRFKGEEGEGGIEP